MTVTKRLVVCDAETRKPLYCRQEYRNKKYIKRVFKTRAKDCGLYYTTEAACGGPEAQEKFRQRAEANYGSPVVLVEDGTVEYFNVM